MTVILKAILSLVIPAAALTVELEIPGMGHLLHPTVGYYGSAIAYDRSESEVFLLTVAHLLPHPSRWHQLTYSSDLTGFKPVNVHVIGQAPGHDIAVLSIPVSATSGTPTSEGLRGRFSKADYSDKPNRFVLIGVPDVAAPLGFQGVSVLWDAEARLRWNNALKPQTAKSVSQTLSDTAQLHSETECAPVFLPSCYWLPMKSWGFSGGLLLASADALTRTTPIIALASHYSPLAETTYFIPSHWALQIADALREHAHAFGRPFTATRESSGLFEYMLGSGAVRILSGRLAGAYVFKTPLHAAGGEVRGGGGDPLLQAPNNDVPVRDWSGNVTVVGDYAQYVRDTQNPMNWGAPLDTFIANTTAAFPYKGLDSLLRYRPGITVLSGGTVTSYYQMGDGQIIQSLNGFLKAYAKNPNLPLKPSWDKRTLPARLTQIGFPQVGLRTQGSFRPWDMAKATKKLAVTPTQNWPSLGLSDSDQVVGTIFNIFGAFVDPSRWGTTGAFSLYAGDTRLDTIGKARLNNGSGRLDYWIPYQGWISVVLPHAWEQLADFHFQARGVFQVGREKRPGVALLTFEPGLHRYEFRLLTGAQTARTAPPAHLRSEQTQVEAVFVPMTIEE
ncbi:hypothetical protein K2X33_10525 [bacterium]|nr:hypothetical protein [bacterium]